MIIFLLVCIVILLLMICYLYHELRDDVDKIHKTIELLVEVDRQFLELFDQIRRNIKGEEDIDISDIKAKSLKIGNIQAVVVDGGKAKMLPFPEGEED